MNALLGLALLCVSPIETAGNITIANRLPAICSDYLGSPPLLVTPIQEMAYNEPAEAAGAVSAPPKAKAPKKAKKPAKRARCKPGRTRNAKGICGRWR